MFHLSPTCCWWSGQSWPYATTQTLAAMANLLRDYPQQKQVTKDDYFKLLRVYSLTHRKDGRPYIAEAANPDTGSWKGHDTPGHSNHYFHSGYTDLVITGLVGLRPRADDTIEVEPARAGRVGLLRAGRRRLPRPPGVGPLGPQGRPIRPRGGAARARRRQGVGLRAEADEADGPAARRAPAASRRGRDGPGELRGEQRRDATTRASARRSRPSGRPSRRSLTGTTGITSNPRTAGPRRDRRDATPIGSRSTSV